MERSCRCGYIWDPDEARSDSDEPVAGKLLTRGAWVELMDLVQIAVTTRCFRDDPPIHNPEKLYRRLEEWAESQAKRVLQCAVCGCVLVEEEFGAIQMEARSGAHLFSPMNESAVGLLSRMEASRE